MTRKSKELITTGLEPIMHAAVTLLKRITELVYMLASKLTPERWEYQVIIFQPMFIQSSKVNGEVTSLVKLFTREVLVNNFISQVKYFTGELFHG